MAATCEHCHTAVQPARAFSYDSGCDETSYLCDACRQLALKLQSHGLSKEEIVPGYRIRIHYQHTTDRDGETVDYHLPKFFKPEYFSYASDTIHVWHTCLYEKTGSYILQETDGPQLVIRLEEIFE